MKELLKKWEGKLKELDDSARAGCNDPEFFATIETVDEIVKDLRWVRDEKH